MGNKPIISIKQYNPEWYPPCFKDREQYKNYMWSIVKVGLPSDGTNYCLDCTREYKIKMLKEKRCEHPETIFVEWRNTDKSAEEMVGSSVIHQNKPDVLGISNISKFWSSPIYDQHYSKIKELPSDK